MIIWAMTLLALRGLTDYFPAGPLKSTTRSRHTGWLDFPSTFTQLTACSTLAKVASAMRFSSRKNTLTWGVVWYGVGVVFCGD